MKELRIPSGVPALVEPQEGGVEPEGGEDAGPQQEDPLVRELEAQVGGGAGRGGAVGGAGRHGSLSVRGAGLLLVKEEGPASLVLGGLVLGLPQGRLDALLEA